MVGKNGLNQWHLGPTLTIMILFRVRAADYTHALNHSILQCKDQGIVNEYVLSLCRKRHEML